MEGFEKGDGKTVISGSAQHCTVVFLSLAVSFHLYLLTFALFRVWDIKSGKTLVVYKDHTSLVVCVGIGKDGKTAITGSSDHTARFFTLRPSGVF